MKSCSEYIERLEILLRKQRWKLALKTSKEAIQDYPDSYMVLNKHALALWYSGEQEEAITTAQKAIEIEDDYATGHYNLACFHAALNNRDEMLAYLKKAIALEDFFKAKAKKDEDFKPYRDDEEFKSIAGIQARNSAFDQHMNSDDAQSISAGILMLDREIDCSEFDWEDEEDELDLEGIIESHYKSISTEALLHLMAVLIKYEVEDFYPFGSVLYQLESRLGADFYQQLNALWWPHYEGKDCGHLGSLDHSILTLLANAPPELYIEQFLTELKQRSPDILEDYQELMAQVLADLPASHIRHDDFVHQVDELMHAELYKNENIDKRKQRIVSALPPSQVPYDSDNDIPHAYEKALIANGHPQHLVNAAGRLAHEKEQSAQDLLASIIGDIQAIVVSEDNAASLRIDAIAALQSIKDITHYKAVAQAYLTHSVEVLRHLTKWGSEFNSFPKQSEQAVEYLLEQAEKCEDRYERHDIICAIRHLKDPRIIPFLNAQLDENGELVRREALYGLGMQKAQESIELIVHQLKNGSSQCVTAAAWALAELGEAGHAALMDEANLKAVVQKTKSSPRFTARALNYFKHPSTPAHQLAILKSTTEFEALPLLADGIAMWGKIEQLADILALGLDCYRRDYIGGRAFLQMFIGIAQAQENGNNEPVEESLKRCLHVIEAADQDDVKGLAQYISRDGKYANIERLNPEQESNRHHFESLVQTSFAKLSPEAEALAQVMFKPQYRR